MLYAEASYFDGFHFAHIGAYEENKRNVRRQSQARTIERERRNGSRARNF